MKTTTYMVFAAIVGLCMMSTVSATQLGINYYHETMMGSWGDTYIPRSTAEIGRDMDDIKTVSSNVKFFMNPFMNGNLDKIIQVNGIAKQKGMHTVVTMMVDDRQLDSGNWNDYANRVVNSCNQLNGKVNEILVGNEITLHSSMSRTDIKNKVVDLIGRCKQVYGGEVSYQEFWYAKDVWTGYNGKIYFMFYENLDQFRANIDEMRTKFGNNGVVGEWGEDIFDEGTRKDENWQKDQIQQRLQKLQSSGVSVAYVFSYREPSYDTGFGLLRADGSKKPAWYVLTGGNTPTTPPPTTTPTTLSSIPVSCTASGSTCTKKSDVGDNTCRYIIWGTVKGDVKVTACNKASGIEIYRSAAPSELTFSACFGGSCVNQNTGFTLYSATTTPPPTTPTTPPTTSGSIDMNSLSYSCAVNGQGCWVKTDDTSGSCRTIVFGSSSGDAKIQGCDKGNGYVELYKQQAPSTSFSACLANGCLNQNTGYVKFLLGTTSSPTQPTTDGVNGLPVTASPSGTKTGDYAEGTSCRKVQFTTSAGFVESRICNKGGNTYEMYLLSTANDANVCVGTNCVGKAGGFKSFTY
jgi:hypothetical protein